MTASLLSPIKTPVRAVAPFSTYPSAFVAGHLSSFLLGVPQGRCWLLRPD